MRCIEDFCGDDADSLRVSDDYARWHWMNMCKTAKQLGNHQDSADDIIFHMATMRILTSNIAQEWIELIFKLKPNVVQGYKPVLPGPDGEVIDLELGEYQ